MQPDPLPMQGQAVAPQRPLSGNPLRHFTFGIYCHPFQRWQLRRHRAYAWGAWVGPFIIYLNW